MFKSCLAPAIRGEDAVETWENYNPCLEQETLKSRASLHTLQSPALFSRKAERKVNDDEIADIY